MNPAISEPFLLSSYQHKQRKQSIKGLKSSLDDVYVSSAGSSKGSDGFATVTVQADGVHVLDLSSLHPVVSYTLGPAATFPCPAASRHTNKNGSHICTTYAATLNSSSTKSAADGNTYTVRMWRENVSASLDVSQKKTLTAEFHDVVRLYVPDDADSGVFLLSSNSRLTVTDGDLNVKRTHEPIDDNALLIESFVFTGKSCMFPSTWSIRTPCRIFIVLIIQAGGATWVQVLAVDDDTITELGSCDLRVKPDQICGVSCSPSGHTSVITLDGIWHSFRLECIADTIHAAPVSDPIHLKSLTFISSRPSPRSCDEIGLLSLSSSHVLLVGVTKEQTPEIVLMLWDLQYSVLLASHTMPIPSTLSYSEDAGFKLNLVNANASQALLVLSPTWNSSAFKVSSENATASSRSRSSVLVVPLVVPAMSTIASAMGRANDRLRWLALSGPSPQPSSSSHDEASHDKLFQAMRTSLEQNNGKMASEAFFKWERGEMARLKAADHSDKMASGKKDFDFRQMLTYEYVKQLLGIILPSKTATNAPRASSEVLRYLLNKGAISANMIDGGLLSTLLSYDDWPSIELALGHVRDIPESELMSTLRSVISYHRRRTSDGDVMQVDEPRTDGVPTLPTFLAWCVTYRTTPAALRLAIREHLQDVDDLICLLGVIERWISTWGTKEVEMLALPPTKKQEKITSDLPPLIKILVFLQVLLDASMLTMIQHAPSHAILRQMQALLEPEIAFTDEVEQLRGPLEPFAKAQARGGHGKKSTVGVDPRMRKKQEQEQIGLAVGLYRLEQLTL